MNTLLHTFMALSVVSSIAFVISGFVAIRDYSTETIKQSDSLKTLASVSLLVTFILLIIKTFGGF